MGARKKAMTIDDIKDLQFLTIKDVCKRTTFSRTTVKGDIASGALKSEKKRGRRLIKISDFVAWLEGMPEKRIA